MSLGEGCLVGRGVLSSRVLGAILGPWVWISNVLYGRKEFYTIKKFAGDYGIENDKDLCPRTKVLGRCVPWMMRP